MSTPEQRAEWRHWGIGYVIVCDPVGREAILDLLDELEAAEAENAKLREAIANHECTEVFTAGDGYPAIRVGNEAELREALATDQEASE